MGGAWCPKYQVTSEPSEYLQIDFQHLKVITLVETQGRFDQGQVMMMVMMMMTVAMIMMMTLMMTSPSRK